MGQGAIVAGVLGAVVGAKIHGFQGVRQISKPAFAALSFVTAAVIYEVWSPFSAFYDMRKANAFSALKPFMVVDFLESSDLKELVEVESSAVMLGTKDNNLMIADLEGSRMFAKSGLNYMIANQGNDKFYFSLCSTKVHDGKTSVIANFEDMKDKIYIFCSKHQVSERDLHLSYNSENDYTMLAIEDGATFTAITILGDHPELKNDIILNEHWVN